MVAFVGESAFFNESLLGLRRAISRSTSNVSAGPAWSQVPGAPDSERVPTIRVRVPGVLTRVAASVLNANLNRLTDFSRLPEAWDGRRGKSLTFEAFETAVSVLIVTAEVERPTAQLVPLSGGGVQIEWHVAGNDLEVEIDSKGSVHVLYVSARDEVRTDREVSPVFLSSALGDIRRNLRELAEILSGAR